MTDATEMPKYDGMEYEELVVAAQFLWMENAKLRELCADTMRCITYDHDCRDCVVNGEHCDASILFDRMRELGVEAEV